MRTTCPTCETGYSIPDERIGAKGRKVRCTKCGEEWRVFAAAEEPAAPRAAPPPKAEPTAAVDPFDAISDDDVSSFGADAAADVAFDTAGGDAFDTPDRGTFDGASDADAGTDTGSPTAADETTGPAVAAATPVLPRPRIRIRTKRRFPAVGKEMVAKAAVHVTPLVGPAVFLAACLVLTGVYVFRQKIVATAPDLAGLYSALGAPVNLRGLIFGRIETLREIDNGQPVLVVEGSVSNVSPQMRELPALRFALRGPDTQEIYAWSIDPKSTTIDSGDTIRFRTRLAAPPDLATEVQVRFVERRSQHAGLP
ncbi:zinc-ribbon domain-containing protein [Pinisolibacter sp.]|uniref:zinc-ribbon domain-containing protein n=1 Tax=Pinisolibacter sp. TaxID=2172024 RepID=UPI002FDEE5CE